MTEAKTKPTFADSGLNGALAPKQSRREEFWLLFRQNRLSILGLILFILFFFVALAVQPTEFGV